MRTPWLALPLLLTAATARADGGFVAPPPTPESIKAGIRAAYLAEPEQQAVLQFDGTRETLYLSVRYEGDAANFGWLVPVPARPEVEEAPAGLVADIANFEYQLRLEAWKAGRLPPAGVLTFGGGGGGGKAAKPEPVEVVETKRLGAFDVAVLRASEAGALEGWLTRHGFALPDTDAARAILAHYVEADMYFCAARVALGKRKRRGGWLTPLTLSFATGRPFFPLRISALHMGPDAHTQVTVHAFLPVDALSFTGRSRLDHPKFHAKERLFRARDLPACVRTFAALREGAYTLTTFTSEWLGADSMRDLWLATTADQAEAADAERRWAELRERRGVDSYRANVLRLYLADCPDSPRRDEARAALAALDDDRAAEQARGLLRAARLLRDAHRYKEAADACQRAGRVAPDLADEARALRSGLRAAEADHLATTWAEVEHAKQEALDSGDAHDFFARLVAFLRLCKGVHQQQNLLSQDLADRYHERARVEMAWLERHHARNLERNLAGVWSEVEWLVRRDPARAQRGLKLLLAVAPGSRFGKKAAALDAEMHRGLR